MDPDKREAIRQRKIAKQVINSRIKHHQNSTMENIYLGTRRSSKPTNGFEEKVDTLIQRILDQTEEEPNKSRNPIKDNRSTSRNSSRSSINTTRDYRRDFENLISTTPREIVGQYSARKSSGSSVFCFTPKPSKKNFTFSSPLNKSATQRTPRNFIQKNRQEIRTNSRRNPEIR